MIPREELPPDWVKARQLRLEARHLRAQAAALVEQTGKLLASRRQTVAVGKDQPPPASRSTR